MGGITDKGLSSSRPRVEEGSGGLGHIPPKAGGLLWEDGGAMDDTPRRGASGSPQTRLGAYDCGAEPGFGEQCRGRNPVQQVGPRGNVEVAGR